MKKIAAFVLAVIIACFTLVALADEYFIICNPESYVCVRRSPRKGGIEEGRLEIGEKVQTDGKKRNGFVHCVSLSTEWGEGWVYRGYLTDTKPVIQKCKATVAANGRVACRRNVKGKVQKWVRPCTDVTVYALNDEWAVTNKGFIRTMYLEVWYEN